MLQQTQVDRVLPKYREFLRRYPSIEALARARVGEVREVWYPLGYNVRPVRLWGIANEVVRRHEGRVPAERAALLGLKGIGPYTAGAVRAFAFRRRAAVVDTNVRRVLQRVFFGRARPDRQVWALAERLLPRHPYDFNQALMDFGALVCTARAPACARCPMASLCRSYDRFGRGPAGVRAVRAVRPERARPAAAPAPGRRAV
ncbi:MAG: A/G-specific adenine glycosylase [Armatimonadetes bacterium]|nr:A/G-specific adenine glycosylase [Armatimonadota bacterium]